MLPARAFRRAEARSPVVNTKRYSPSRSQLCFTYIEYPHPGPPISNMSPIYEVSYAEYLTGGGGGVLWRDDSLWAAKLQIGANLGPDVRSVDFWATSGPFKDVMREGNNDPPRQRVRGGSHFCIP